MKGGNNEQGNKWLAEFQERNNKFDKVTGVK